MGQWEMQDKKKLLGGCTDLGPETWLRFCVQQGEGFQAAEMEICEMEVKGMLPCLVDFTAGEKTCFGLRRR